MELVRTGVYSGCSFEFWPKDYEKRVDGDEVTIIHHSFEAISALTIGLDPAYVQTSVNVREMKAKEAKQEEEEEERACDDDKRKDDVEEPEALKEIEDKEDDKEDDDEGEKFDREHARRQAKENFIKSLYY